MFSWKLILPLVFLFISTLCAFSVTYTEGQLINLTVTADRSTQLRPNSTVRLNVKMFDNDYELGLYGLNGKQVKDPVTVTGYCTAGTLQQGYKMTSETSFTWTAPSEPGIYAVIITADDSLRYADDPPTQKAIEMVVQQNDLTTPPVYIKTSIDPKQIRLQSGGTANAVITARAYGATRAGKTIKFSTNFGSLSSPTAVTDADGIAMVSLVLGYHNMTIDQYNDLFLKQLEVLGVIDDKYASVATAPIQQSNSGVPVSDFQISANPKTMSADGYSTSIINITLTDAMNQPIVQQPIQFATDLGSIDPLSMTDNTGRATVTYRAPGQVPNMQIAGIAHITAFAQYLNKRAYTNIAINPSTNQQVQVTVNPANLIPDGYSTATVDAVILDTNGFPRINIPVNFTTSLGTLQPTSINTDNTGHARVSLISPRVYGQATISATALGATGSAIVSFNGNNGGNNGGGQANITVSIFPQTLTADGTSMGTVDIVAMDALMRPMQMQQVFLTATLGTIQPMNVLTDLTGHARATIIAPRFPGQATISAQTNGASGMGMITFIQGNINHNDPNNPYNPNPNPNPNPTPTNQGILLTITPKTLNADGLTTAQVLIRAINQQTGQVYTNMPIALITTAGKISPKTVITDATGSTLATYTSPYTAEDPQAAIIANGPNGLTATGYITLQTGVNNGNQYNIKVVLTPASIDGDGNDFCAVDVTVTEAGTNRLAGNQQVTLSTNIGTLAANAIMTDRNGRVRTTLTAPLLDKGDVRRATVTAAIDNDKASAVVEIVPANKTTIIDTTPSATPIRMSAWQGQTRGFVAGNWMLQQYRSSTRPGDTAAQSLNILDDDGKILREIPLSKESLLVRDNYGTARGYTTEENGRAQIIMMKPDGSQVQPIAMNLQPESHVLDAKYSDSTGHVMLIIGKQDKTKPEVYFISPDLRTLVSLSDGLKSQPVATLSNDGYMGVATTDGSLILFGKNGEEIFKIARNDDSIPSIMTVGANGDWVALLTTAKSDKTKPKAAKGSLTVYGRDGKELLSIDSASGDKITQAGKNGLILNSDNGSAEYYDLKQKKLLWSIKGGYAQFLASGSMGIIAGQWDKDSGNLISRLLVIKLSTGQILAKQDLYDLLRVESIQPPDEKGLINVISGSYVLKFALPAEN
ncbi:MAG: Ig-like domain-containing protein [bacterium]